MNISGGKYKGRKIIAPSEKITRPTLSKVRMGIFNMLYSMIGYFSDYTFLDVFAGSGIMGLEAISRGFKDVTAIEVNKQVISIIKENYNSLDLNITLKNGDATKIIPKLENKFDVAYLDPPYKSGIYEKTIDLLLDKVNIIIAEHPKEVILDKYNIIKQKKYGDTYITFIKSI